MQNTTSASTLATKPAFSYTEQNLQCPRCESTNTKFCYFNNYNLSQPRHFCKDCRRYWTRGGALRNIPVGGGTRRNSKKPSAVRKNTVNSTGEAQRIEILVDEDNRMLDVAGSFSSLLCSTSLFGNILDGDEAAGAASGADSFLGLPVESIGWPDLTIYTPDTRFE